MTLATLRQTHPTYAEAYRLCVTRHMTHKAAALVLGVSTPTARERVQLAKRLLEGGRMYGNGMTPLEHNKRLARLGRCKCGLLWPCLDCVPTSAAAYAQDRSGAGRTMPEGGGW